MFIELRPCDLTIVNRKSGSDPALVPMTGAAIYLATRQGATPVESKTFDEQETHTVAVVDAGRIRVGDLLWVDLDESVQLHVDAISADRRTLTLQNYGKLTTVSPASRLRPSTNLPVLYQDHRGHIPDTSFVVDTLGHLRFYSRETFVDVVIAGGPLGSPAIYTDLHCGSLTESATRVNAGMFPSIQAAIDSLPAEGGTVFVPAGIYDLTETLYTPCDRPCHLLGEGSDQVGAYGTVLRWNTNTGMLRVRGDDSSVRGMTLRMMASGVATGEDRGYGILVGRRDITDAHPHPDMSGTATEHERRGRLPLQRVHLEDITILESPGWGLTIPGFGAQSDGQPEPGRSAPGPSDGGTLSFDVTVNRVRISASRKYGALFTGGGCTTLRFTNGACYQQGAGWTVEPTCYVHLRGTVQPVFRDWVFEGTSPSGAESGLTRPWVQIVGCDSAVLDACWFENDPHWNNQTPENYDPQYFVLLAGGSHATTLRQLHMVRGKGGQGRLRLIYCAPGEVDGLHIDQPFAISVDQLTLEDVPGSHRPLDTEAIALNGEQGVAEGNKNLVVSGSGIAFDAAIVTTEPNLRWIPITFASVPRSAHLATPLMQRVPLLKKTERSNGVPNNDVMFAQAGALAMEDLVAGSPTLALLFCRGNQQTWCLANNLPSLSTSARDTRTDWVQGDMILNVTAATLEVYYQGTWRVLSGL